MNNPFDIYVERYDAWFDRHHDQYMAEIEAVRVILPVFRNAVEIGVGTGRFAVPLGIPLGVEPSPAMAAIARRRGVEVIRGHAECLPLPDNSFDLAVLVTTICFVRDPLQALREVHRILRPCGHVIIAFVDKNSTLGKQYEIKRNASPFYRNARFFDEDELNTLLDSAEFEKPNAKRISLVNSNLPGAQSSQRSVEPAEAGDFTVLCAAITGKQHLKPEKQKRRQ
ncbi:MAG: class I SAM-dependent methyltransferase [Planctomycetes bacterium]|nr:class I SAM-dependent methyltransferase [Planctomycetota bacterium]